MTEIHWSYFSFTIYAVIVFKKTEDSVFVDDKLRMKTVKLVSLKDFLLQCQYCGIHIHKQFH